MKPYIYLLLFLSIFTRFHLFCAQRATRTVGDLVHRVTQSYTTDAFARQIIAVSPERQHELERACNFFETTPGFLIVLKHIARSHSTSSVKGYWYELEKALALHRTHSTERSPKVVKAFGSVIATPDGSKQREFDIVANIDKNNFTVIECKAINWHSYHPHEAGTQFLDQNCIALTNKANYKVSSQKSISKRWIDFFAQHEIDSEVDLCNDL